MDNTIIQQGVFTSTGLDQTLIVRSDLDWLEVVNYTQSIAQPGGGAVSAGRHYWQRGMPAGLCVADVKAGASDAITRLVSVANSVTLFDSSTMVPSAPVAVTAGTNATQPVYSTANTLNMAAGAVVRIANTAHTNINGLDFSVDTIVANTSFRLANTLATAPGLIAGALGTYRLVAPNAAIYGLFYPRRRIIANITGANPAVVTTLVDHGFQTGQTVRLSVPATCGMTQMNGLIGTVTVVNASTFSVNIDSSAFTAFNFPLPAVVPFTPAEVIPVGSTAGGVLTDATINNGFIGIVLGGGLAAVGAAANGPAGVLNDVVYWRAGKSFNM